LAVAHARMEVALSAIRVPQIRTAVGCAHLVHNECALSKGGSGAVLPLPGNLYLAPIIGVVMALVVVAVVGYRKRKIWNTCRVTATSAWDASDSWVTNTAGVGSAVAAIAASGSISSFVTKVNADAFVLLSLLFGGCAAIAPVVYGVFSKRLAGSGPEGTKWSVILASIATLTSAFGLFVTVAWIVYCSVIKDSGARLVLYLALGLGAILIAVYSVRAIDGLLVRSRREDELISPEIERSILGNSRISGTL
jgi:hypothetical protein